MNAPYRAVVRGCGSYLPERILTNAELARTVDTSDQWIVERTGIKRRHVAAQGQLTSHLALESAKRALAAAGMKADAIDLIVLATTTPDSTFPATATRVQAALGIGHGAAFDVQAVCSGFVYALGIANNFLALGQHATALVIGAETFTRILDWSDRGTCVLFGDGAGALVLAREKAEGGARPRGVLSTHIHSDGRLYDLLYVDGGPSSTMTTGHVRMHGPEVYKHAVNKLAETVKEALAANGLSVADVDWFVPHQANKRIIDSTAKKLGLAPEKIILTIEDHANTSAASIPLALDAGVRDGRIKPGQIVVLEAMGGGLSWGSAVVRW
ncbi:MAG TPA: beta-ketoacyl-ACP synthase III [Alphaproteobacteria bacterium]|jgi:3-oxoacyl-[acyl-carrier-protein] synthase-3